jgi:hypothetical protein
MTFGGTMDYHFVASDTSSKLQVTCKRTDTGAAIDVSAAGTTVTLYWSVNEGAKQSAEMTKTNGGSDGIVDYTWQTGELVSGQLKCEVEIDDGGNKLTSLEAPRFTVRERIP